MDKFQRFDKLFKFVKISRNENFVYRSVVHDVSEIAGLATHSFGEEDVDRHIQVHMNTNSPNTRPEISET